VSEQTQKEILMRTTKETQAMHKVIAEAIAKVYIIDRMAKGLNLELREGPDFPTGIWGFGPTDQNLFTYSSGVPDRIGRSKYIIVSRSSGKVIFAGFYGE
jgi:hypothetical protein